MGSLGAGELVVIALVAIVVFGPKRLPEIAQKASQLMKQARDATQSLTDAMDEEFDGIAAPLKELKSEYDETMKTIKSMATPVAGLSVEMPDGSPGKSTEPAAEDVANEDLPPAAEDELAAEDDATGPTDQGSEDPADVAKRNYDQTLQSIRTLKPRNLHASFDLPNGQSKTTKQAEPEAHEAPGSQEVTEIEPATDGDAQ